MLGITMAILFILSIIYAVITGNGDVLSDGLLDGAKGAVEFCFKICGSLCFFCGLAKVAEQAGITAFISKLLRPIIKIFMPDALKDKEANEAVCLNISSNMLGLGNAATPFGIKGSKLLYKQKNKITRSLASFILINTASVQLIPTTVIAVRQANNAANAASIIPSVLIVQILSCTFGLLLVSMFFKKD